MSERERWVVYPLLFLALGAALRDKLLKTTVAEQIHCEQLFAEETVCRQLKMIDKNGKVAAVFDGGVLGAGAIDANQISIRGQRVSPGGQGGVISLPQLMELFKRAGVQKTAPTIPPEKAQPPEKTNLPAATSQSPPSAEEKPPVEPSNDSPRKP